MGILRASVTATIFGSGLSAPILCQWLIVILIVPVLVFVLVFSVVTVVSSIINFTLVIIFPIRILRMSGPFVVTGTILVPISPYLAITIIGRSRVIL